MTVLIYLFYVFSESFEKPHLNSYFISDFQLSGDGDRSQEMMRSFSLEADSDLDKMNRVAAFGAKHAGYPIPRTQVIQDVKQKSLCRLRV